MRPGPLTTTFLSSSAASNMRSKGLRYMTLSPTVGTSLSMEGTTQAFAPSTTWPWPSGCSVTQIKQLKEHERR
jgi:hypothetical protein